jgi:thiamine pyrophosphate-dependent acetolactate synthase large subunit-like protein
MISPAKCPYLPHSVDATIASGRISSGQTANLPENEGRGFEFVKFAEACGAMGDRVVESDEIKTTLKRGIESAPPVKLMVWGRFLKGAMNHPFVSTGSTGFQDI